MKIKEFFRLYRKEFFRFDRTSIILAVGLFLLFKVML